MNWYKHTMLTSLVVLNFALGVSLGVGDEAIRNDSSRKADSDTRVNNQMAFKDPGDGKTPAPDQKESSRSNEGREDEPKAEPGRAGSASQGKAPLFKDFVPSERIAPDQAVDFPVGI
jgi:hypothetical protein